MTRAEVVSKEECAELSQLMARKYAGYIEDKYFQVKVNTDEETVYASVTLRNASGSFYYPVEARMLFNAAELSGRDAALFMFDYIDLYFDEYMREGGGVYLPIDWADYECEGLSFQLKGQILNLELERLADEFLQTHGDASGDESLGR